MEINNSHFGVISLKPNDMTYMLVTLTLNGRTSPCNLFIGKEVTANPRFIQQAAVWLDRLEHNDRVARAALIKSYESGNQLIEAFVDFHLEEVFELIQEKLGIKEINHHAFLENLDLCGVGMHVSNGNIFFDCDYSIGKEFIDELLVVKFDAETNLLEIAHES